MRCCVCGLWDGVEALADLGELTARWLEGDLNWNPTLPTNIHQGVHSETRPYVDLLAAVNRRGFVTVQSQPGEVCSQDIGAPSGAVNHDSRRGWHEEHAGYCRWQRAHVDGYVDEATLESPRGPCERTGLTVASWPPGVHNDDVGVTSVTDPDRRHLWWAGYVVRCVLPSDYPQPLRRVMETAQFISIIDPEAGRNDRLWPALEAWLREAS